MFMMPFANGSISLMMRGLPPFRIRMTGFPVRARALTRFLWFSDRARSERLPGVSQYEFSPIHAMMTSAFLAAAAALPISGAFSSSYLPSGTYETPCSRRTLDVPNLFFSASYIVLYSPANLSARCPCQLAVAPASVKAAHRIGIRSGDENFHSLF